MHKDIRISTPLLIFLAGCDNTTPRQRSGSPANQQARPLFGRKPLSSPVPKEFVADEPVVAARAPVSRTIKLEGARVVLLRAGFETVFTEDVHPKKSIVRLWHYAIVIEPRGEPPQGPPLTVGSIEAVAAGTDATVRTGLQSGSDGKGGAVKEYDGQCGWIGLPEFEDELASIVEERWIGPVVVDPERIDRSAMV